MKKLLPLLLGATLFIGCKKQVENVTEDLIVQNMIKGQWVITQFTQSGNNVTTNFSGYKFQFYSNKTVDAIKNGVKERTGNWGGSTTTMTTWVDFASAPAPIIFLNGTWDVIDAGFDYLEARQTNGTEVKTLELERQ